MRRVSVDQDSRARNQESWRSQRARGEGGKSKRGMCMSRGWVGVACIVILDAGGA